METFVIQFRRLLLVIVCALVLFNSCREDETIAGIHVDCTVSFEVTDWVIDELCWLDCLGKYPISTGEVNETQVEGIVVPIFLSHPATDNGTFHVSFNNDLYGKAFVTVPAPSSNGVIEFSVANGELSRNFTVLPINNNEHTNGFVIQFNIGNYTGTLHEGVSTQYMLTIVDDEN